MSNPKLQIRRGVKFDLDSITLNLAELGYCTDTNDLYIGGSGEINNRLTSRTGQVNIPNGQNTVDVVFTHSFDSVNYYIGTSIINTIDNPPSIYSYIITNKITTGFTVLFSNNIDSSNYVLEYIAR